MNKPKHFFSTYTYKNDLELLDVVLSIYAIVELKATLTEKERVVMRYYLKNGYTDKTKKAITGDSEVFKDISEVSKTRKHLDQINLKLDNKGFLQKHTGNYRLKIIAPGLIALRDSFLTTDLEKKTKFYSVYFTKDEQ